MDQTARAIMLGIRHRCGQEIQFWIPADLVAIQAERLDEEVGSLGLTEWMQDEGILDPEEELPQDLLVERLRTNLTPRGVAFIHVDTDASMCPTCGGLLRWLDILTDYAQRSRGTASP
jgi:hypothetical protein